MRIINNVNGADRLLRKYLEKLQKIETPVVVMMGIAYGGDVQMGAEVLPNGKIYGYDTFEDGHPRHLAARPDDFEASCMEHWYQTLGTKGLSLDWQRQQLEEMGLSNATLIKGEVDKSSCYLLKKIDLAWLDMDLLVSMENGFHAVESKIVKGGYLITHDVDPKGHIAGLHELFYDKLIDPKKWKLIEKVDVSFFTVWQKK